MDAVSIDEEINGDKVERNGRGDLFTTKKKGTKRQKEEVSEAGKK